MHFCCRLEPSYIWIRNDEIIAKGNALLVNKPMQHADAGVYTCIARNKHGNGSADANINILCEYSFIHSIFMPFFNITINSYIPAILMHQLFNFV